MTRTRKNLIKELLDEVSICKNCRLWQFAKNAVPGEGSLKARLMLVGEAPGYNEDIQGRPFVGSAGKLLDEMLAAIGMNRELVYITNIVKHRPPKNRLPRRDEVVACTPYLSRQVSIIRPKIIAALGLCATSYMLSQFNLDVGAMSEVRGKIFHGTLSGVSVSIIPTYHPAAELYARKYRRAMDEDFRRIRTQLGKSGREPSSE